MDAEGFIKWALADDRTVEERYVTELLVELGVGWWNSDRKIYKQESIEVRMERKRQRALNPAYDPRYSAEDVRKAAESWPRIKTLHFWGDNDDRPMRDLSVLRFFTQLESISISYSEAPDISVFALLPRLQSLSFGSRRCEDFGPIGRCVQLRELSLSIGMSWWRNYSQWPAVAGLEQLVNLEKLSLTGNLLTFAPGVTWPKVRGATLSCEPLAARSVRDLPQVPACEFLTLKGVERLDGIAAYPRLRNLTVNSDVRDFAPLTALQHLTSFTCGGFEPLDVSPLARLPKLAVLRFNANYKYTVNAIKPRDFSPLTDAPALRELHVENCPPVVEEVRTLNAVLQPWDDEFLAPEPRPLPPTFRFVLGPWNASPDAKRPVQLSPADNGLPDQELRNAEGRWVARFVTKLLSARLGCNDWGTADAGGAHRSFSVTIESYDVVEKLPLIIEVMREAMTRLRDEYVATLMVNLKVRAPEPTEAQRALEEKKIEEEEEADYELRRKEQDELLERLHRYELKKQLGDKIDPQEFVPKPRTPPEPVEPEDLDDDDADDDDFETEVDDDDEPAQIILDDEDHPLAEKYRLYGHVNLQEVWFMNHQRDAAIYVLGRQPDLEIPDEKKPE
ncbi:MAG: hypothetical protein RLY20_641 [Verrucomicrobiota bacterium]|jgi:hypothetical protein